MNMDNRVVKDKFALNGQYIFAFIFVTLITILLVVTSVSSLLGNNASYSSVGATITLFVLGLIFVLVIYVTPVEYILDKSQFTIRFLLRSTHIAFSEISSVSIIDSSYFSVSPFRKPRLLFYGVQALYFNDNGGIDRCFISSDDSTLVRITLNKKRSYILTIANAKMIEELQILASKA